MGAGESAEFSTGGKDLPAHYSLLCAVGVRVELDVLSSFDPSTSQPHGDISSPLCVASEAGDAAGLGVVWSGPAPWMSIILYKGDIRSYLSDCVPAPPLPYVCWLGSSMSPFYPEGDLAGMLVSFSLSVRRM
jgi:hypothetical protein